MTPRIKKLIGTVIILVWLVVYAILAAGFGRLILPHAGQIGALAYYAVAGLLWAVPIGLLLPWMYREPRAQSGESEAADRKIARQTKS